MAYTTIDDPSAYFHTQLYTGTGSTNAITNDGNSDLQPDFIWLKDRSTTNGNAVQDTSRGITNVLFTNGTDYENQYTNTVVDSVQSDGFTVSTNANSNTNTNNYVAWQWKVNGGTTSSNTDGSITSTVQADTTAGFSIVTYTGTGSNATVGHGLGATPKAVIVKNRDSAGNNWFTHWTGLLSSDAHVMYLAATDAQVSNPTAFNSTAPTSSVFSVGTNTGTNENTSGHVAYCFSEVKGYSKIGVYTGNSSTDGPFIYTGFKPAFVMLKRIDATGNWVMMDSTRDPFNVMDSYTRANLTDAELTSGRSIDFLSNGFKLRNANGNVNTNYNYLYMCFASSPFASSEGVPTTAR